MYIVNAVSKDTTLKQFLNDSKYKSIIFIDGDCGSCMGNLNAICTFFNQVNSIKYLFVIKTGSIRTFEGFCELKNLAFDKVYDHLDSLRKMNALSQNNIILLNERNELIDACNPLQDRKSKYRYIKIHRMNKKGFHETLDHAAIGVDFVVHAPPLVQMCNFIMPSHAKKKTILYL
jgi:hypothetical protein